jgi:hypothetical protein
MPRPTGRRRISLPLAAAAFTAVLILVGALVWFRPFLARQEQPFAEVPAPAALFVSSAFSLAPHSEACMNSVTITPQSEVAEFTVRPTTPTPSGGPPLELRLQASGYEARTTIPGGYPGGAGAVPIKPPKRSQIGNVCFRNLGKSTALLDGTTELRTLSRPLVAVDGRPVYGDIALAFRKGHRQSLVDRLGEAFAHASNLTDRLVPAWLIWLIAVVVAFGVPAAIIAAFYRALREDEARATG